jgi:hypothetical protein
MAVYRFEFVEKDDNGQTIGAGVTENNYPQGKTTVCNKIYKW